MSGSFVGNMFVLNSWICMAVSDPVPDSHRMIHVFLDIRIMSYSNVGSFKFF
jgi:hypothetical protein